MCGAMERRRRRHGALLITDSQQLSRAGDRGDGWQRVRRGLETRVRVHTVTRRRGVEETGRKQEVE